MEPSQQPPSAPQPPHSLKKAAQRQHYQTLRRSQSAEDRARANDAIRKNISTLIRNLRAKRVAVYAADADEPGGVGLADYVLSLHCEVWLPVSLPQGVLEWGQFTGPESLTGKRYGIPEPAQPHYTSALLSELDLVFVPALAATARGIRLGKGGGYYDRALEHCHTPTALLLFEHEANQTIVTHPHDAACDWTITPGSIQANLIEPT
ncbi:5-formyltetrahydrofolate cyclo-ligase [Corynebacterium gerontici]|nr:5-formyltetrahydrofolate cyclo-ligase [Corynebacterium gerontici]